MIPAFLISQHMNLSHQDFLEKSNFPFFHGNLFQLEKMAHCPFEGGFADAKGCFNKSRIRLVCEGKGSLVAGHILNEHLHVPFHGFLFLWAERNVQMPVFSDIGHPSFHFITHMNRSVHFIPVEECNPALAGNKENSFFCFVVNGTGYHIPHFDSCSGEGNFSDIFLHFHGYCQPPGLIYIHFNPDGLAFFYPSSIWEKGRKMPLSVPTSINAPKRVVSMTGAYPMPPTGICGSRMLAVRRWCGS